ncbi:hypothetical protein AB0L53_30585 [Nonomuraea sp. NPDC052129]|uniref:hypothetical protein n=1 Tax=Nonomuraea sp. NPDC052129 TaxID=3154651 RepID=UPI00342FE04B
MFVLGHAGVVHPLDAVSVQHADQRQRHTVVVVFLSTSTIYRQDPRWIMARVVAAPTAPAPAPTTLPPDRVAPIC